jgi:hypothetical protein
MVERVEFLMFFSLIRHDVGKSMAVTMKYKVRTIFPYNAISATVFVLGSSPTNCSYIGLSIRDVQEIVLEFTEGCCSLIGRFACLHILPCWSDDRGIVLRVPSCRLSQLGVPDA